MTTTATITPLHRQRLIVGRTQKQVAKLAGISQPSIGLYEAGEAIPRPSKIANLAAALGRTPDQLIDLIDATLRQTHQPSR